jgi:hypothetical protein
MAATVRGRADGRLSTFGGKKAPDGAAFSEEALALRFAERYAAERRYVCVE